MIKRNQSFEPHPFLEGSINWEAGAWLRKDVLTQDLAVKITKLFSLNAFLFPHSLAY